LPGFERKYTRVDFETTIKVATASTEVLATRIRDISLGGLFIVTDEPLPMGAHCTVCLDLKGPASLLEIKVEGEVVRVEEDGVGLVFTKIDADSLIHLHHIVKIHAQDPTRIDSEYYKELLEVDG
jgi:c-di-GMP-binding flagellar brake protein YcgR